MIRDTPEGAALLAQAREVLRNDVLPTLAPDLKYQTLMVIKAITLAQAQLTANTATQTALRTRLAQIAGDTDAPTKTLAAQIRNGTHDAASETFEFLNAVVTFKLSEISANGE